MILLQLNGGFFGIPLVWVILIGGLFAFALGVLIRVQIERRRGPLQPAFERLHYQVMAPTPSQDANDNPTTTAASPSDAAADKTLAPDSAAALQTATTRFEKGRYTQSIHAAYSHTRTALAERFGIEMAGTHRDFYDQCVALDTDIDVERLNEFTEIYERVMFSPASIDQADAERALELAGELTEEELPESEPAVSDVDPPESKQTLLQAAATQLSHDRFAETIQAAYSHTRTHLAEEFDIETAGTHRDFYEECRAVDHNGDTEGIEELTKLYERAVFGADSIGRADAERALELARDLTDSEPERHADSRMHSSGATAG